MTFLLLLFGLNPARAEALPPIAVAKVLAGDKLARLEGRLDLMFRYGPKCLDLEGFRDPDVRKLVLGLAVDYAAFGDPAKYAQLAKVAEFLDLKREGDHFSAPYGAEAARAFAKRLAARPRQ